MLSRFFLSLFIFLLIYESFPQKFLSINTFDVDSLLSILPNQQAEERINTLNNLAVSRYFEEFDLGWQNAEEAMNLAKDINYQEGIADAFRNFGYMNFYQGNYPDALNSHFESLAIYEKLDKKKNVAKLYSDIASGHFYARNYEKAIDYSQISLDIYRQHIEGSTTVGGVRDTLDVIGNLQLAYTVLGMYGKSVETALVFMKVAKENNFRTSELVLHTFIAGRCFYLAGKPDSAKVYLEKALAYPDVNPHVQALKYRPLTWLGFYYMAAGDFNTAVFHLKTAFDWYNKNGYLYWAIYVANNLGNIFDKNNELNSAENYYRQSEMIYDEMLLKNSWFRYDSLKYVVSYGPELYSPLSPKHTKELMWIQGKSMYYNLYQINVKKENTSEALKYHIAFHNATDTLNKLQRTRKTMELQTKFETERKEGQIVSLSQENAFQEFKLIQSRYFLMGLGGLVLLVVILAIVLIRQNKLRHQQQNLLMQQRLFRSQMNPHFIFNSLTSIQGFITEKDPRTASRYLSRFAKLIRNILDSSVEEFIPLAEEITTIENYLELQKVRYEGKFDYSIEVDEKIDTETLTIPPMLTQPFIENSIEHGFKHEKNKGALKILVGIMNNILRIEVEDNGVGREKGKEIIMEQNKKHKSLATSLTQERIRTLNKKLNRKVSLNIQDLKDEKEKPNGTKVVIEIPV